MVPRRELSSQSAKSPEISIAVHNFVSSPTCGVTFRNGNYAPEHTEGWRPNLEIKFEIAD